MAKKASRSARKGWNKLPVQDLRAIAHFNRIVLNYLKMDRILSRA
jgi:hypothetical protein